MDFPRLRHSQLASVQTPGNMLRTAALHVCLLALLPLVFGACPDPNSITIDSSIRVFSDIDWKYGCHTMLKEAKSYGGDKINFIPTHFWNDTDDDLIPNNYALRHGQGLYLRPTKDLLAQYQKAMTICFKKAVTLGFKWIEVTPHLDDGNPAKAVWRNLIKADPFEAYGGFSYVDVLIDPLMNALMDAVPAGVDVYMSIQGEMNSVLIHNPKEWNELINYMRKKFAEAPFDAKIGINNNFNKICPDPECPVEDNWAPKPGQFDLKTIGAMYDNCDFIAISAYAPQDVQFPKLTVADMENSIDVFAKELQQFGVSLRTLLRDGKGFHYSEFGIGGGIGDGSCPQECAVKTALEAAKYPFQGIGGPYNPKKDPWRTPAVRDYMHRYFGVATQFAAKGTGGTYKVDCIFMWNAGSYDVQGISPASTVREGTYKDPIVVDIIKNFNTKCALA